MARDRRNRERWSQRVEAKARRLKWFSLGCAAVTAAALAVVIAVQLLPHQWGDHAHPASPHGGQIVSLERGSLHYHAEILVEPTGTVRLYPLGEDPAKPFAAELQHIVAVVRPDGAADDYDLLLRPDPGTGSPGGRTTAFVGRLPADAVAARLLIRVPALRIGGESFAFEVSWSAGRSAEEVAEAYEAEQRRIYLTPGGKYTEGDIAASGRATAAAKYRGRHSKHETLARPGDQVCPITGFKASAAVVWPVSGEVYQFCCQPCIDDFVLLAKERPAEIRKPEDYTRKP
jgi:hypothetical protein